MHLPAPRRHALLAAALIFSACGGAPGEGAASLPECASVAAADGPGTGSTASHGQVQRSEGDVSISPQGGQFRATRLVSLANDFGGAEQAQVQLDTQNGHVISCAREGGGYRIHVLLEARGATEADARAALDSMTVNHGDTLAPGLLRLSTQVLFAQEISSSPGVTVGGTQIGIGGSDNPANIQRVATILAGLPTGAAYAFDHSTSNGDVHALSFSGTSASLDSSDGSLDLAGRWDSAALNTSNGVIHVSGDYAALDASSSNGYVEAALATARSSTARLSSSNGSIEVGLQASSAGLDLQASTTNGSARITASGTEAVGAQTESNQHRRTPDYTSRAVQVSVSATTTNGSASIQQ